MKRRNIINDLIVKLNFENYLELGIRTKETFNSVICKNRMSVDCENKWEPTYCYTIDDFFKLLDGGFLDIDKNYKWDLIFIDACHKAEYVYRDTLNSVRHLNDKGILVLHDVFPVKWEFTIEDDQNGTAWKVVPYILKYHPELNVCVIPERNGGCGIVTKNLGKLRENCLDKDFNVFYDFYLMDVNRKKSQNIIVYSDLIDWIKQPYYNK